MKTYEMKISVFVQAETPDQATEKLIEEFDYVFSLDNDLIAYTHPQTATEETTGT